jgi:hypothetical protein
MEIVECKTLTAILTIGLQRGYSDKIISEKELKDVINIIQHEVKNECGVLLSAKLTHCEILFLGQEEPSATLEFIQYPKFLCDEKNWVTAVISFSQKIMVLLDQNRTVIIFPDKTLMLEASTEIDPRINVDQSFI